MLSWIKRNMIRDANTVNFNFERLFRWAYQSEQQLVSLFSLILK